MTIVWPKFRILEKDLICSSAQEFKKKGYRRRYIFAGWNNYTDFEKEQLQVLKDTMKEVHGIDLNVRKEFGPRAPDSIVVRGAEKPQDGMDYHFTDQNLLRFLVTRQFKVNLAISDLLYHLQWR